MAVKKQIYDENSIQVLEGLEAVRRRPGMYIGSTDSKGLHHLVWEIVDNAIDEALAGYCTTINVKILADNSIIVEDDGRGIPTGMHKTGKPTPEVIFNVLHAGGKFDEDAYKVSGGLHGVGSAVVNALSEYLEVTIYRDGKVFNQKYSKGGKTIGKPTTTSGGKKRGTTIHFKPDGTIFSTTIYDYKTIADHLKESAFLIKGLKLTLLDERGKNKKSDEFYYENGIQEFVKHLTAGKTLVNEPTFFKGDNSKIHIECSISYAEKSYSENILSFVNNIRTHDGGTHEVGFRSAITKAVNDYARLVGTLKERDANLEGSDVREGLTCVLSLRVPEELLQFEGQTKNKLGTPEARQAVETVIGEQMKFFLSENGDIANTIINNAMRAYRAREAARKARDEARLIKSVKQKPTALLGKLTPCQVRNPQKNELFIVEGDSAGGSAKQGRDRSFQAILPLRGKVLNCEKCKTDELVKNEEIMSIINAIGGGFGSEFDIKKSNYKKIIIMTDADNDGAHIQILLLTFFFRYLTDLVTNGYVYIATPPLYKIATKNKVEYAWSDDELREKIGNQRNVTIQRYKGLGEMNAEQLWDTTMNPAKRTLIQVNIEDFDLADNRVSVLMGDEVEPRRDWINNNIAFDEEDNFRLADIEGEIDE